MAKKEVETIFESASRASARELCPYAAENRSYKTTESQLTGTIFHAMASRSLSTLNTSFSEVFDYVIGDYTEEIEENGFSLDSIALDCVGLFENFIDHKKIRDIFDDPDSIYLIDGQNHQMAQDFERGGKDRILLVNYLNKKKKNAFYGYPDLVLVYESGEVEIIDFKTGMTEDSSTQLKVYASIVFEMFPGQDELKATYLYLRTRRMSPYTFTRKEIESFQRARVKGQNAIKKAQPEELERRLNRYCTSCEFMTGCSACAEVCFEFPWVSVTTPSTEDEFWQLYQVYERAKIAEGLAKKLKEQAKDTILEKIEKEGGSYNAGENCYIRKESASSYEYDIDTALEVIEENKIPMNKVISISKAKIEKWLKENDHPNRKQIVELIEDGKIQLGSKVTIQKKQRVV